MSVANALESTIVISIRLSSNAPNDLDLYLVDADIEITPLSLDQFSAAKRRSQRFGRGNHPAKLNFGDCFAYALAEMTGEPLLFRGFDLAQTDVLAAVSI